MRAHKVIMVLRVYAFNALCEFARVRQIFVFPHVDTVVMSSHGDLFYHNSIMYSYKLIPTVIVVAPYCITSQIMKQMHSRTGP